MVDPTKVTALQEKIERYYVQEARERYEGNLTEFLQGAWSSIDSAVYQQCWAIDAICDHLEAVSLGHIPRLLINVPPRCSKTTVASICWPAWTWARTEESYWSGSKVKFLCGSYNGVLAMSSANTMRRLLMSTWYQKLWGKKFELTEDQNTKNRFDNTLGGSRQSTSVGGSLLGLGGDILIVDDPHNTETEKVVETDTDRIKVESWWKELSGTRLNSPKESAIVVVMQRLHERDLSGVILDSDDEDWTHLMIPMEHDTLRHNVTVKLPQYDDDEPWEDPRTEEGELMWPERFGEVEVARIKSRLGVYMAAGRLQQEPVPKGGGIIKRDWWLPWDSTTAQEYGLEWNAGRKEFPHFELVVGSVDTSYGRKEENDYNAMTVWGIWLDKAKNRRAMLMYAWAKRMPLRGRLVDIIPGEAKVNFEARQREAFGLIELIADTCKRYKVRRLLVENKTRGQDVADEIKRLFARENFGVELLEPVGDKTSRTHSIVPLFNDDGIWAPNTKWAEQVITQSASFPKADHDDLHDTVTQFLNWARENGLLTLAEETSAMDTEVSLFQHHTRSVAEQYGV